MFKRNFIVVYRPIKNNFLLLPENYYNLVSSYEMGCLSLEYNNNVHYSSWAPYVGSVKNTEIGINARIAKEIGLSENDVIRCSLITDLVHFDKVFVTPVSLKDWEILELNSEKLSNSILDQIRVVNARKKLLIWLNRSTPLALIIDRTIPIALEGRIDHNTEVVIKPYPNEKLSTNGALISNKDLSYQKMKSTIIDNTTNDTQTKTNHKQINQLQNLKKRLNEENCRTFEFRVVQCESKKTDQHSDVYLYKSNFNEFQNFNNICLMETSNNREYYVQVHPMTIDGKSPHNLQHSIGLSETLRKLLDINEHETVVLKPQSVTVNYVEKIEISNNVKIHYKIIENAFKRFVIEKTKNSLLLLNQNETLQLDEHLVSIDILPKYFKYCVINSEFLKEGKIYAADARRIDDISSDGKIFQNRALLTKDYLKLPKLDETYNEILEKLKTNLNLNERTDVQRATYMIIAGPSGTGKTVLVERLLDELTREPYYCYCDIFYCSRNKGRKVESIQKDLRKMFANALRHQPSVVVLENLDVLAHDSGIQIMQDCEYYNRIADILQKCLSQSLISTKSVAVIATVNDLQSLNSRLYFSRGKQMFNYIYRMTNLESEQREMFLEELCRPINAEKLNLAELSTLTQGFNKKDLTEFVERALFYAYRIDKSRPSLTNDAFYNSLDIMNSYYLYGNENQSLNHNAKTVSDVNDEVPGLESAISALEEVLVLPSKFPSIFNSSPIPNQAGVLLYGPPGTGKTFLVNKIAASWNLRTIYVKGPELLAKYIGQSEENVRILFNKAQSAKPCVLFFDEFDSLAPKRGHDSTGVTDRVVNQILTELDGVEGLQGVIVIAATSRPELLDPALLRSGRIDRLIECPLPNAEARKRIFEVLSRTLNFDDTVDFAYFASKTQNYTGADIRSILTSANMLALKEALNEHGGNDLPNKIFINKKHLQQSFNTTRPSLNSAEIHKYKMAYARFNNRKTDNLPDTAPKRSTLA